MFHKRVVRPVRLRMFYHHLNPIIAMIGIIAIVSIVAWGAKARLTSQATTSPDAQRGNAPIPTNIQVETFTLGFGGFEPKEIDRKPGPFVLGINNYNHSRDASFELVREDGNRVLEIKWPSGQTRYRKLVHLPPGNYQLKEVNHPDWTAQIIIGK